MRCNRNSTIVHFASLKRTWAVDENGNLWGFQLWANLPASHKTIEPRYQEIKSSKIPELLMEKGLKVRIICGNVNGIEGSVREIVTDPEYIDVTVPAEEKFHI
ncbi:MAG: hypothetical protein WB014_08640 [Methanosarcina sp.]